MQDGRVGGDAGGHLTPVRAPEGHLGAAERADGRVLTEITAGAGGGEMFVTSVKINAEMEFHTVENG